MFLANTLPAHGAPLDPADAANLSEGALGPVRAFLSACGEPRPTPLHSLPSLAAQAGVAEAWVKDESGRLGLDSFKALGGAYAVFALVLETAGQRLGRPIGPEEASEPDVRRLAAEITVACATDGNHGRAVASGAQRLGARAVVFMHQGVSPARAAAIQAFGATVVRVRGSYDDSVAEAARRCAEEGWLLVSDTGSGRDDRAPRLVMQGYAALAAEALAQAPAPPTHVFVQAGVGGLAAAVAGHFAVALGARRPRIVVVEPARAACVLESARAGRPVAIPAGSPTVMAMLECYEPSASAWAVLERAADGFLTIDEDEAVRIMQRLARPGPGDPALVAGESGGVGLAGLLRAAADPQARAALGLDAAARVLTINTEGATDPQRYRLLVGREPGLAPG
jgi:diaminopropionate ammonia-lyase